MEKLENKMYTLSNFVLGLAVNTVFDIGKNVLKPNLKQEIEKSFDSALKKWSINPSIREKKKDYLKSILDNSFFGNEDFDMSNTTKEIQEFFIVFNRELCVNQAAFNYFKDIKDRKSFEELNQDVKAIRSDVESIIEKIVDHTSLMNDWRSQLDLYENLIKSFKPNTAFELVTALEKRIVNEGLESNELIKSKIEFLKGLCLELDTKTIKESHLSFIRAHEYNKQNSFYQEKACFSYYKTEDLDSANSLVNSILTRDKFNVVANCVKVLINLQNFEGYIEEVPNIIKEDINFRRLLYVSLNRNSNIEDYVRVFPKIILSEEELKLEEVTYENYKLSLYKVELVINKFLRENRITFNIIENHNVEFHNQARKILSLFVNTLKSSELRVNNGIRFFSIYLNYLESNDSSFIKELKEVYEDFVLPKDEIFGLLLANVLQIEERENEAVEILSTMDKPSHNILRLKVFCANKTEDVELIRATILEIISSTSRYSVLETTDLLRALRIADSFEALQELKIQFPSNVTFDEDSYKTIVETFINSLNHQHLESSDLEPLYLNLANEDLVFKSCILQMFFRSENYNRSIEIFESFEKKEDLIPLDIQIYISSLQKLNIKNKELLQWLQYWRENIVYRGDFARIEIQKLSTINDWQNVLIVSKEGYSKDKNEYFLLHIIISCYYLTDKNTLVEYLPIIRSTEFTEAQAANQITQILLKFDFNEEAFELGYKWAKERDNKNARTIYFSTILLGKELDKIFINYESVIVGSYVRYNINDHEKVYTKIIENDIFSQKLLGLKIGDEIDQQQTLGTRVDRIKIVGIVNKYLALKLEIMEETGNPHSGLGFQAFKIDPDKNILDELLSIFPKQERQSDPFEDYYTEKITFSQLAWMSPEINGNLIFTYYKLVHEYKGLIIVGLEHFVNSPTIRDARFILDFSSLPHFYELSTKGQFKPKVKFVISSYSRVLLKQYEEDRLSYRTTENYSIDKEYYIRLNSWINANCEVVSPISLLDITADKSSFRDPLFMYLLSNTALLNESVNSILITDDLTFYKVLPLEQNKLISSNYFIMYHQLLSKFGLLQ